MATIRALYPDQSIAVLYDVGSVGQAIEFGATLIRDDGTPYNVTPFGGGLLFDGCPINRILYGSYTAGQAEALAGAGIVCWLDQPASTTPKPPPATTPGSTTTPAGSGGASSSDFSLVDAPPVQPIVQTRADGAAFIGGAIGGPVGFVVGSVADLVLGIFGLFSGGIPKAVAAALGVLRDGLAQLAKELIHIGQLLAKALAAILAALQKVYEKVIKPILDEVAKVGAKIAKIIDKVLKPYLNFLQRIRKIILDVYKRIFLPIITTIQQMRKALALLKILHVPGVAKLDAKLQKVQGKLIGVIDKLLQKTSDHAGLLNTIITAKLVLQRGVFMNSAYSYQGQLQRLWWDGQTRDLTDAENATIAATAAQLNSGADVQALQTLLATGSGAPPVPQGPDEQALLNLLQGKPS